MLTSLGTSRPRHALFDSKRHPSKSKNDSFHRTESSTIYILSRFLTERHTKFRKVCLVHRLITSGKEYQDNEQNNWN